MLKKVKEGNGKIMGPVANLPFSPNVSSQMEKTEITYGGNEVTCVGYGGLLHTYIYGLTAEIKII